MKATATKTKLTPEEKELQKTKNRLISKVKKDCKTFSLRQIEIALEFLKPQKTQLPNPELSLAENIDCYEKGIARYKELLSLTKR